MTIEISHTGNGVEGFDDKDQLDNISHIVLTNIITLFRSCPCLVYGPPSIIVLDAFPKPFNGDVLMSISYISQKVEEYNFLVFLFLSLEVDESQDNKYITNNVNECNQMVWALPCVSYGLPSTIR